MSYDDNIICLADYAYTGICLFAQRRLPALDLVLHTRDYNLAPSALVVAVSKIKEVSFPETKCVQGFYLTQLLRSINLIGLWPKITEHVQLMWDLKL